MCVGVKSRGLIETDGGVSGCFWVGGCRKKGDGGGKLREETKGGKATRRREKRQR